MNPADTAFYLLSVGAPSISGCLWRWFILSDLIASTVRGDTFVAGFGHIGMKPRSLSGACGDLVPKDDELGVNAARKVGENLAMASVAGIIDMQRNAGRFVMERPRLGAKIVTMESRLRAPYRKMFGRDTEKMELQVLSIGDVAFVGVPGELVNELGLEIKWHSPFKRTFIAYCATDYFGYISTLNQVAAGGYEPQSQHFASRDTLRLVATVQDALLDLRAKMFPEDCAGDDPYPDNLALPLVNLPGGVKASKWQRSAEK